MDFWDNWIFIENRVERFIFLLYSIEIKENWMTTINLFKITQTFPKKNFIYTNTRINFAGFDPFINKIVCFCFLVLSLNKFRKNIHPTYFFQISTCYFVEFGSWSFRFDKLISSTLTGLTVVSCSNRWFNSIFNNRFLLFRLNFSYN